MIAFSVITMAFSLLSLHGVNSQVCSAAWGTGGSIVAVVAEQTEHYKIGVATTGIAAAAKTSHGFVACAGLNNYIVANDYVATSFYYDCTGGAGTRPSLKINGQDVDLAGGFSCIAHSVVRDGSYAFVWPRFGARYLDDQFIVAIPSDSILNLKMQCGNSANTFFLNSDGNDSLKLGTNGDSTNAYTSDFSSASVNSVCAEVCLRDLIPADTDISTPAILTLGSADQEFVCKDSKFLKANEKYYTKLKFKCTADKTFIFLLGTAMHKLDAAASCETLANSCPGSALDSKLESSESNMDIRVFVKDAKINTVCTDKKNITLTATCVEGKWNYTRGDKYPEASKLCDNSALPMFGASIASMMMIFFIGSILL